MAKTSTTEKPNLDALVNEAIGLNAQGDPNMTLNSESLKQTAPLKLTAPKPETEAAGLGASLELNAQSTIEDLKTKADAAKTKKDSSLQSYLIGSLQPGKTALEDAAYSETVDPLEAELKDINQQILQEQVSRRRRLEKLRENPSGLFGGALEQEMAKVERESIAKEADLSVIQLARQGKYDSAKAIADRGVAAKLEGDRAMTEALRINYEENKDSFSTADQRLFETQQKERETAIETEAAQLKAKNDLAIEFLKSGGDIGTANAIMAAGSLAEAASIMGGTSGIMPAGVSPVDLAYAQQYASTGQIPTGVKGAQFGRIAEIAKTLPKQKGTIVDATTGVKSTSVGAAEQSDFAALQNIIDNAARLKELNKMRNEGIVGGTLAGVFGLDQEQEYLTVRKAIIDDLARMQTGAALTADEQAFYNEYLPGRFSHPFFIGAGSDTRIDNFIGVMENRFDTRTAAYGLSSYGYSKVNLPDGQTVRVGETIESPDGTKGTVLPDGSIFVKPGESVSLSGELGTLASSIIQQESGGDYSAVGIPTAHGRALGKYQIIPKFHFAKVGLNPESEADRQKFLNSPQLQDRAFTALMEELNTKYNGDPRKIAAAYYGGGGAASIVGTPAADKPQKGGMPSINQYVESVISRA